MPCFACNLQIFVHLQTLSGASCLCLILSIFAHWCTGFWKLLGFQVRQLTELVVLHSYQFLDPLQVFFLHQLHRRIRWKSVWCARRATSLKESRTSVVWHGRLADVTYSYVGWSLGGLPSPFSTGVMFSKQLCSWNQVMGEGTLHPPFLCTASCCVLQWRRGPVRRAVRTSQWCCGSRRAASLTPWRRTPATAPASAPGRCASTPAKRSTSPWSTLACSGSIRRALSVRYGTVPPGTRGSRFIRTRFIQKRVFSRVFSKPHLHQLC